MQDINGYESYAETVQVLIPDLWNEKVEGAWRLYFDLEFKEKILLKLMCMM